MKRICIIGTSPHALAVLHALSKNKKIEDIVKENNEDPEKDYPDW